MRVMAMSVVVTVMRILMRMRMLTVSYLAALSDA